jgi:hypothetical protein
MRNGIKRSRLFEELILKSWWTILFFLICFFSYDQAVKRKNREEQKLQKKFVALKQAKEKALEIQGELKRQIASQNDPDWVELVLMHRLGLVPDGQQKVHFQRRNAA